MTVESVSFRDFRNLSETLSFGSGVNLLLGVNGEGKTNIAEGVWLFSAGKSFRGATDREMIRFGAASAELSLVYTSEGRQNELKMVLRPDERREIYKNGIRLRRTADIIGDFSAVAFTPATLGVISEGPSERRRFADIAISQLKPSYMRALMNYNAALSERNACLKLVRAGEATDYQLLEWECMMAPDGARVTAERKKYIERLAPVAAEEFSRITGGKETLTVGYLPSGGLLERETSETAENLKTWNRREPYGSVDRMELFKLENALLQKTYDNRKRDVREGSSSIGPHRDELIININGKSARDYASQGQKRSAALALKAAECRIVREETGEEPVVILDDVFSELDAARRRYVLDSLSKGQSIITSCETARLGRAAKGRVFAVKAGTATVVKE